MRLATKLILLFLLLAVLPLTWITYYSYRSSITAFRAAAEAESRALAEIMGARMGALRHELAYRMERLGRFPFKQLMVLRGTKDARIDSKATPLLTQLMNEIGDTAPLLDLIEFNPEPSISQTTSALPQRLPSRVPTAKPSLPTPNEHNRLIIHVSPETLPPPSSGLTGRKDGGSNDIVMHIHPTIPTRPSQDTWRPPSEADKQKLQAQIKQIQELQVGLEETSDSIERQGISSVTGRTEHPARDEAGEAPHIPLADAFAGGFSSKVRVDGDTIGTVTAHVSSPEIFRRILSRGRRQGGEISFLVSADNALHSASPEEQKELEALGLPGSLQGSGVQAQYIGPGDWVVVTRKDEDSNITFGIARPISGPLRQIRRTAIHNLAYGLGFVGLVLLGIFPLANRMTRNLTALTDGTEKLALGDLNTRVLVRSRDEIGRLAESFNKMAHDLGENQKKLVEQERLRKELQLSRRIQEELLPKRPLQSGFVEVKGISMSAREVGGDFFNYFALPGGDVAVVVGDVSGTGLAAALLMANLQATLRARLPLTSDLEQLAGDLDQEIYASTPEEVFVTLFMCIHKVGAEELRYISAGHNPQFVLRANGDIEHLESTGRPLGLVPGGGYPELQTKLSAGDGVFFYTDGLVESVDEAGREFGQQRLENLLLKERMNSTNKILSRVEEEIRMHHGAIEASDDITMLVLRIGTQDLII